LVCRKVSMITQPDRKMVLPEESVLLSDIANIKKSATPSSFKPIILFFGNSGVGKSTILTQILRLRNYQLTEVIKNKLNVQDSQEGTTDFVGLEDEFCIWVDARGKRQSESDEQYVKNMTSIQNKQIVVYNTNGDQKQFLCTRIDFAFVVVLSEDRDCNRNTGDSSDLHTFFLVLKGVQEKSGVPFAVIFNKHDLVEKQSAYQERFQYCTRVYKFVPPSNWHIYWPWNDLCRGFFKVSASPVVRCLPSSCPNATKRHDYFLNATFRASICITCNMYWQLDDHCDDFPELIEVKLKKYVKQPPPSREPEGINLPVNAIMQSCSNELSAVAVAKSVSKTIEDRLERSASIIENCVCRARIWAEGPETDQILCKALGELFDLPQTASRLSEYEKSCWKKSSESWLSSAVKWIFGSEVDPIRGFLAAWGSYYARKFFIIVRDMTSGAKQEQVAPLLQQELSKVNGYIEQFAKGDRLTIMIELLNCNLFL